MPTLHAELPCSVCVFTVLCYIAQSVCVSSPHAQGAWLLCAFSLGLFSFVVTSLVQVACSACMPSWGLHVQSIWSVCLVSLHLQFAVKFAWLRWVIVVSADACHALDCSTMCQDV